MAVIQCTTHALLGTGVAQARQSQQSVNILYPSLVGVTLLPAVIYSGSISRDHQAFAQDPCQYHVVVQSSGPGVHILNITPCRLRVRS